MELSSKFSGMNMEDGNGMKLEMPKHSSSSQSEADATEQLLGRFLSGGGDSPTSSVRGVKTRIGVVVG